MFGVVVGGGDVVGGGVVVGAAVSAVVSGAGALGSIGTPGVSASADGGAVTRALAVVAGTGTGVKAADGTGGLVRALVGLSRTRVSAVTPVNPTPNAKTHPRTSASRRGRELTLLSPFEIGMDAGVSPAKGARTASNREAGTIPAFRKDSAR